MEKIKAERSLIAKKAWRTRRKKNEHVKSQQAGIKAQEKTRKPVEYGYIDELANTKEIGRNSIFHHEGIPDIMLITKEGKLRFYEIKPKKGAIKRKMLNLKQVKTIKKLLEHNDVEEVNLVRYEKKREEITYDPPIKLTKSNIMRYARAV